MPDIITLPDDMVVDAVQALDRYRFALENNLLAHKTWQIEEDGRRIACMLGVLGRGVTGAGQCPAAVMPGDVTP